MTIVCTASKLYFENLKALINSIAINYPSAEIVIRLVNCDKEDHALVQSWYTNLCIIPVTYTCSTSRIHLNRNGALLQDGLFNIYDSNRSSFRGARWLYSDFMARCINDRYQIILDLFNEGSEQVLSIDADTIIRKDLSPLRDILSKHDIILHGEIVNSGKVVPFGDIIDINNIPHLTRDEYLEKEYKPNNPDYIEWHTGVIGFNNTQKSIDFLKDYTNILLKPENVHIWGAEEEEIYFLFKDKHRDVKIYNIPIMFKDEGYGTERRVGSNIYRDSSYIWVGAGQNKYNCTMFTDEVKKYEVTDCMHK